MLFKFTKTGLLKKRKQLMEGMILDMEIDIETEWLMLNLDEKKKDGYQKEIDANIQEIKDEKNKTPMDMEKVKELIRKNVDLGYKQPDLIGRKDNPVSGGKMAKINNTIRFHQNKIEQLIGEREYTKLRLKAVNRMMESGYMNHFDEIIKSDEEITFEK